MHLSGKTQNTTSDISVCRYINIWVIIASAEIAHMTIHWLGHNDGKVFGRSPVIYFLSPECSAQSYDNQVNQNYLRLAFVPDLTKLMLLARNCSSS